MEDRPFAPNHRAAGDLTHPVADHQLLPDPAAPPFIGVGPDGEAGMSSVREDAEGAIHYLLNTTTHPAVLLARAWHVRGIPFSFEQAPLYHQIAAASGCSLVSIARDDGGGLEHLLFAARVPGLTEAQCLACIEPPAK